MGYGIALDGSSDDIYVTGESYATWQGDNNTSPSHPYTEGRDIVVLKLAGNGTYQWHTFYGSNDVGRGISIDTANDLYVAGYGGTTWQGDHDRNPLHPHSGQADIVVLKLARPAFVYLPIVSR